MLVVTGYMAELKESEVKHSQLLYTTDLLELSSNIVKEWILPATTISVCWSSYKAEAEERYKLMNVNH
jgi:hypothetical protein